MFPETFNELLVPAVLVGIFISVVLSKLDWYQNQDGAAKQRIYAILTFLALVLVAAFNTFVPEDVTVQIGGYYLALRPLLELLFGGAAATWVGGQVWYSIAGKRLFNEEQ